MNTKLKCLLLDDELPGLSYLKLLCEQIPRLEVVKAFNDPALFLKEYDGLEFDLCILDIEMPGFNGIELASMLKSKQVIFTTAYKEYATDAFDLDAVDYVVKPVKPERLQQAVNKAIQRIYPEIREKKNIRLNTDKGIAIIDPRQIGYIRTSEIDPRDKILHSENGNIYHLKNISFEKLIAMLPSREFCRVNKQELIAMNAVLYYSNDQITTSIHIQPDKPLIVTLGDSYKTTFIGKISQ